MKEHRIAVIPGDGIGREVIPEGVRALEAVAARHDIRLNWTQFDWSCDYYMKHGKMRPDDAPDILRKFDAIYFGAVGDKSIPDHITLWGLRLRICQGFDQYANVRPARILPGITGPLLFNPGAFAQPQGLTFGNAGRNILRNPSRTNVDTSYRTL